MGFVFVSDGDGWVEGFLLESVRSGSKFYIRDSTWVAWTL